MEDDATEKRYDEQDALQGAGKAEALSQVIEENPNRQDQERPMQINANSRDLSQLQRPPHTSISVKMLRTTIRQATGGTEATTYHAILSPRIRAAVGARPAGLRQL